MGFRLGKKDQGKAPSGQKEGYTREKSRYEKGEGEDGDLSDENGRLGSPEDPEALKRLREDPDIRALMEEAMAEGRTEEGDSLKDMLGKGVSTLARSLRKASRGDDDLLDSNRKDGKQE